MFFVDIQNFHSTNSVLSSIISEPISEFPVDLLIFHIVVPVTISYAKPKRLFKTLFENWWRLAARQLRMTSFMFGGRHPEEEGAHVRKTWWAWITRRKAPIPTIDDSEVSIEIQNQDVYFARDGGLVRAPFFDGVPVKVGRRMLIPVDEQGEALDEVDRILGHPASDGAPDNLNTTVVYVPPNFRRRVSAPTSSIRFVLESVCKIPLTYAAFGSRRSLYSSSSCGFPARSLLVRSPSFHVCLPSLYTISSPLFCLFKTRPHNVYISS